MFFLHTTSCEPCEWLVGLIMRGGAGAEQSAAALGAPVATLLRAAADMLMSRGKVAPAQYLYSLSQVSWCLVASLRGTSTHMIF